MGDPSGEIVINVAPLNLEGVGDADYTIKVTNAADGAGDTVWERSSLTSDQFGDGAGSLSYVGSCDASTATNSITLTLNALYAASGATVDVSTYRNPTPLVRNVECVENTDVSVVFDMTIARAANQGFFDVAVSFNDIFCSAKLDCVKDGTTADLNLLHNPLIGDARDMTAVLGFACTADVDNPTFLYMSDPVISCDGGGVFATQDVTFSVAGAGNVDLTTAPATNPGSYLFGAAVFRGNEQLANKSYWNVNFGLNDQAFGAAGNCVLSATATASATPLDPGPLGFQLATNAVYPVIEWSVPLSNSAGRVCDAHAVDDGSGTVATVYSGYNLGSSGSFRNRYSAGAQEVASIGATGPSTSDPFEGATVTASDFAYNPENLFRPTGGVEAGAAFANNLNAGDWSYVSFDAGSPVTLAAVRVLGGFDGGAEPARSMQAFELLADPTCNGNVALGTLVASFSVNPMYNLEPTNLASGGSLERIAVLDAPTTSRCWHARFAQGVNTTDVGGYPFVGTRVVELDAITNL